MKLRNLAYAAMIAVAFTACSNENEPAPQEGTEAGTTLNISIKNVQTKASDSDISSLTAVVVDAGGVIEKVFTGMRSGTTDETGKFDVKQGPKKVMVIANATVPTSLEGQSESVLEAVANRVSFTNEGESKLSMNSGFYDVNIQANTRNYLGYTQARIDVLEALETTTATVVKFSEGVPVKLYRNAAKVVINSIKMGSGWKANTTYPKPSFEVMDVTVVQTHEFSKLASLKEWGPTSDPSAWVSPFSATNFTFFTENGAWGQASPITPGFTNANLPLVKALTPFIGWKSATEDDLNFDAVENDDDEAIELYVYENTDITRGKQTLVTIKGEFSYNDTKGVRQHELRRFTFAVGVTGFINKETDAITGYTLPANFAALVPDNRVFPTGTPEGKAIGALRNLQYMVDLTINGKGYGGGDPGDPEDPDDDEPDPYGPEETQSLDVKVKVVEWGTIIQSVDVE